MHSLEKNTMSTLRTILILAIAILLPSQLRAQYVNLRTLPTHAFHRFINEGHGCVAFLGGSITEMDGWRNMIQNSLRRRFPQTEFCFIDAGISSTGTTPHAFRFEQDVLKHGTPDLLFVEAAVNDDTNHFTAQEQVRGMEGIVRHALQANQDMDIVMLHFIYDPFIPLLDAGRMPDVILNHERVANHYGLTSINLAQEVAQRMRQGELTWEQFGGTHPAPLGHRIYANTISSLFDRTMEALPQPTVSQSATLPEPLDTLCYQNGKLYDISNATHLHGFHIDPDWAPTNETSTRQGFVHVPMLTATRAGSSFCLPFTGRAVGIFCVSGPQACILEYRIDHGKWQTLDTSTEWSSWLYLPWVYMFQTDLPAGPHTLRVRIARGTATECQIRNFVVNN